MTYEELRQKIIDHWPFVEDQELYQNDMCFWCGVERPLASPVLYSDAEYTRWLARIHTDTCLWKILYQEMNG